MKALGEVYATLLFVIGNIDGTCMPIRPNGLSLGGVLVVVTAVMHDTSDLRHGTI